MQDIARLARILTEHPEVEFSVLGPGIAVKAEIPGKVPIVRLRLADLLDDLESALAERETKL